MMRGPAEASHSCMQGAHHSASAVFFNPHELLHLTSLLFPQNSECFALEQAPSFRFTSAHPYSWTRRPTGAKFSSASQSLAQLLRFDLDSDAAKEAQCERSCLSRKMVVGSSNMRRVFMSEGGLRAGWRFLIWFVIGTGLLFGLETAVVKIFHPKEHAFLDPVRLIVGDLLTLVAAGIATMVMMRIERRTLRDYYWPTGEFFGRNFWVGLVWGVGAISLCIALIAVLGGYRITGVALGGPAPLKFVLLWIAASFAIGAVEEFAFRAYQLRTLADGMGFWPAAAVLSFVFGALHYFGKPHERWEDFVSTGVLAFFMCFTVRRTGTLAFAIGWHIGFDWGAIFLYSGRNAGEFAVGKLFETQWTGPDWLTGGLLGPEASWMMAIVIGALFFGFDRVYRPKTLDSPK